MSLDAIRSKRGVGPTGNQGEVIQAARKVTGNCIPAVVAEPRLGDPAALVASSEKIRSELGWQPAYEDLETIVETAWAWHRKAPPG